MANDVDCAAQGFLAILFAVLLPACVCAAAQEQFRDEFAGFEHVHARGNVTLVRQYPRVPNEPDVRINPRDPAHYKYKGRAAGLGWFPWICRLQNGELIVLYRESAAHGVSPCGRVVLSRSKDGGRTWSEPTVVFDRPGRDDREMLVTQTSDGTVWAGAPMLKSTDNGRTWQRPRCAGDSPGSPSRPIGEMANGEFLWIGRTSWTGPRGVRRTVRATFIVRETAKGLEWRMFPHPELGTADEWDVIEADTPGTLVAIMRQQERSQFYNVSRSTDYGRTWTETEPSSIWYGPYPSRPSLAKLDNGAILAIYGSRDTRRMFAMPSFDEGRTWDAARKLSILDSAEYCLYADCTYPSAVQVDGGKLLAVYYVASPRKPEQRGIWGNFLDCAFFEPTYSGATLRQIGATLRPSTVGLWSFDEPGGLVAYDSTGRNYGKVFGAHRVPGRLGGALDFDGVDDFVMITDCDTARVPRYFAIEAWINSRDASKEQTIISKAPRYYLGLKDRRLCFRWGKMVRQANTKLESGKWYHVATVFESLPNEYLKCKFFLNGKPDGESKVGHDYPKTYAEAVLLNDTRILKGPTYQEYRDRNMNQPADNIVIGMDNEIGRLPFHGMIDEVAVHGGGLLPDEIRWSMSRRYASSGEIVSATIRRAEPGRWGWFEAEFAAPEKTAVAFDVLDAEGATLRPDVKSGADLSGIRQAAIRLRARLSTASPGRAPVLKSWSITATAFAPIEPRPRGKTSSWTLPRPPVKSAFVSTSARASTPAVALPPDAPRALLVHPTIPGAHTWYGPPQLDEASPGVYDNWFAALGVALDVVHTNEAFSKAWANRGRYKFITFSYHAWVDCGWLKAWCARSGAEIVAYVKQGGCIIAPACIDEEEIPFGRLFGLASSNRPGVSVEKDGLDYSAPYAIDVVADTPLTRGVGKTIDTSSGDNTLVSHGYVRPLPPWAQHVCATVTDAKGKTWPVVLAGGLGKGRLVLFIAELNNPDNLVRPQGKAMIPDLFRFWRNAMVYIGLPMRRTLADKAGAVPF